MSTLVPSTEPLTPTSSGAAAPAAAPSAPPTRARQAAEQRWQMRLLPLMSRMIVGLTIFFFAATMAQLYYLDSRIEKVPAADLQRLGIPAAPATQPSPEFRVLASLDAALMERRYHQANVFLMGRLWTSYLGFVTGMILALVGAVFILGKMREEPSEVSGTGPAGSFALRSSSPGLVLATLGVVLMITTIVTNHPIQTADAPIFVGSRADKPDIGGTASASSAAAKEKPSNMRP